MDYVLYHHGVKGMKWGVRRYQNKDGSLTAAGRKRYSSDGSTTEKKASATSTPAGKTRYLDRDNMDNYASSWRKKSSENDRRTIDDALYRDWDQGGSNVNRKKVMDTLNAERANNPDYIKLKKAADEAGYGSPEWKKWAAADWDLQGKYVKDYTDATLNDFVESGIMDSKQLSKLSDHGKQYLEGQLDFDSYFDDYRSIMDPITKERDYRLADRD